MLEETDAIRLIVDTLVRIRPEEHLLVVADDYARPQAIAQAVAAAAKGRGASVFYMVVPPKRIAGEEPRKIAAGAMLAADAIFGAGERVSVITGHTTVSEQLMQKGVRLYATLGLSEDYLRRPFSEADIIEMKERSERIAELYNKADSIKVTTPHGTNLTMSVRGRHGHASHPIGGILVPDYSEAATAPVEGTANGTLVYDGEMDGWGYTLSKPLVIKVRNGRVTDISGNPGDAERLKQIVSTDEGASNIGEFAIGTSQTVPRTLSGTRYDCAILGSAHIGLGRNTVLGGNNTSKIHIDGIMTNPTVELDGKTIVRDGEVLV